MRLYLLGRRKPFIAADTLHYMVIMFPFIIILFY